MFLWLWPTTKIFRFLILNLLQNFFDYCEVFESLSKVSENVFLSLRFRSAAYLFEGNEPPFLTFLFRSLCLPPFLSLLESTLLSLLLKVSTSSSNLPFSKNKRQKNFKRFLSVVKNFWRRRVFTPFGCFVSLVSRKAFSSSTPCFPNHVCSLFQLLLCRESKGP